MKPGVRTSEFWLSLAVLVCATVLLAVDKIPVELWAATAVGNGGAYVVSRGLAKRKTK